jgi:hypothetical protein
MLIPGFEGPKEQWRAELEHANRLALLDFIDVILVHLDSVVGGMKRDSLLETARESKKHGKWMASHKRTARMIENLRKFFDELDRRQRSAKKAARRRKKNAR